MTTPRGIRNNNPGNIRRSNDKWQGLADEQPDSDFFMFKSAEWGIRALARTLITYYDKYDLNTVHQIIARFAPASENNTQAYIRAVCSAIGCTENDVLNIHDYAVLNPLIKSIIKHENGVQPYSDTIIDKGLALAGVVSPKTPLKMKGEKVSITGTSGAVVSSLAEPLSQAHQNLEPLAEVIDWVKYISLTLVLIGIGITIYTRLQDDQRRII